MYYPFKGWFNRDTQWNNNRFGWQPLYSDFAGETYVRTLLKSTKLQLILNLIKKRITQETESLIKLQEQRNCSSS